MFTYAHFRLINSHQMMCNMTHLGHNATLTFGLDIDIGSRSRIDIYVNHNMT